VNDAPDPLTEQLASALSAIVDSHYCGHGTCQDALSALAEYEQRFGAPMTPPRFVRAPILTRLRWKAKDALAR
jgi:hypothetical protein